MLGQAPGFDLVKEQFQQRLFNLGDGFAFDGCCRGICVPPPAQAGGNIPHVNLRYSTTGHDVDLVLHLCDGKNGIDILHFDHFMNQKSKVGYILIICHAGKHHLDTVDVITGGCLDHIVQNGHLFGTDFPGDEVGYHVEVGALGEEKGSRLEVFFSGGWECE